MHRLKLQGYLDDQYNLTIQAKVILNDIVSSLTGDKSSKTLEIGEEFKAQVTKYRELFPKGVISGKPLRNGSADLTTRMLWFFKTYPQYTWEHVLSATEKYIMSFGPDLTYCKTSAYFIRKEDKNKNIISLLADWCEAELDEDKEPVNPIIGFNKLV